MYRLIHTAVGRDYVDDGGGGGNGEEYDRCVSARDGGGVKGSKELYKGWRLKRRMSILLLT